LSIIRLAAGLPRRCRPVSSTLDRRARCHASGSATRTWARRTNSLSGYSAPAVVSVGGVVTGKVAAFEPAPSPTLLNENAPGVVPSGILLNEGASRRRAAPGGQSGPRRREAAQERHRYSLHIQLGCLPYWKPHTTSRCASTSLSRLSYLSLGRGGSTRQPCPLSPHTTAV
jgi:hypothetical protein